METLESPTPSVAEGESPLPEGNSSEAVGVGEQQQAEEPSGQVEQATGTAEAAQVAQPDPAQAQEVDEDELPLETAAPKHLREFAERQQRKARDADTALAAYGGIEGFQREYSEPLAILNNPAADIVDKFGAIQRIDPTFSQPEFVSVALDAMPDEMAAPILRERADDAAQILYGDILPGHTHEQIREILSLYRPDEQEVPEHIKQRLEAAEQKAAQADQKTSAFEQQQQRAQQEQFTRQLSEAQLSLGKRMWETPTEHVIGKLKFAELPADAPDSVKQDFSRAQDFVRTQAQLSTMRDPQAQNLLRLVEGQVQAAMKAPPEQRQALMARAERTAAAVAQIQQAKAVEVGTFIKRLLDDSLALRASEASRATNQRAEVAGAGGSGVRSSASRGPAPTYGTPEWNDWLTDGFTPQPAPRQV